MYQHTPLRLLAIAAATALIFTACGGDDDNEAPSGGHRGDPGSATGGYGGPHFPGGNPSWTGTTDAPTPTPPTPTPTDTNAPTDSTDTNTDSDTGSSSSDTDTSTDTGTDPCASVSTMSKTQPVTADEKACILKAHNDARAAVGVGKLSWDNTLADNAYDYAQKCIWDHSIPSGNDYNYGGKPKNYGENLAGGSQTVEEAITDGWVGKEKPLYTPGTVITNSNYQTFGHYTQVVWGDTDKVGCGYAYCPSFAYKIIFVCQYHKAGNVIGEKPY